MSSGKRPTTSLSTPSNFYACFSLLKPAFAHYAFVVTVIVAGTLLATTGFSFSNEVEVDESEAGGDNLGV